MSKEVSELIDLLAHSALNGFPKTLKKEIPVRLI